LSFETNFSSNPVFSFESDIRSESNIECDWIKKWSELTPEKSAFVVPELNLDLSFKDLYQRSCQLAYDLKDEIKLGDRIAVLSPNRIETIILFFAAQRLGAILVPINFRLSLQEVQHILKDSNPNCIFYDSTFEDYVLKSNGALNKYCFGHQDVKNMFHEIKSENQCFGFRGDFYSPCLILYTSGTTGFPKGAVLTNKMLYWNAINTTLSLKINSDDVTINFAPLFHTGGWNVLLTPFVLMGAKVVLLDKFQANEVLKYAEKYKATLLFGVPTMLSMMAETEQFKSIDLSHLRSMIVGGEPMPLDLIQKWHSKKIPIRQGFGLTEFGPNCFSLSEHDAEKKMGSIGRSNFFVKTKIVNDLGHEVAQGEVGELLLSGPSCMKEYWNNPKATEEVFQNEWLKTGDLVKQDQDGYFFVVGRKKDMFISGGENVYPVEVERVLNLHPKIAAAAVVGTKDSKWGEVGYAFLVLKESEVLSTSLTSDEIKSFCREHLASYKVPKYFKFLEELPKGDSGKINKKNLKELVTLNEGISSVYF
jgi:fatty-acyl-CoA synthase